MIAFWCGVKGLQLFILFRNYSVFQEQHEGIAHLTLQLTAVDLFGILIKAEIVFDNTPFYTLNWVIE